MSERKIRIGLIGAGWWASYAHIPALKAIDNVEIVAVARRNPAKLAAVADLFGILHRFTDYREMLRTVSLDAVVISTPHAEHFPAAAAALDAKCHVLLEKPMVLSTIEGERLLGIAQRAGREIVLSLPFLFDPIGREAKTLLQRGEIGRVEFISSFFASRAAEFIAGGRQHQGGTDRFPFEPPNPATYTDPRIAGGGQGQTQAPHPSGFVLWATNSRVEEVFALMAGRDSSLDLFDAVLAKLESGALFSLASLGTVPASQPLQHQHRFHGDLGYLIVDLEEGWLSLHRADGSVERVDPSPEGHPYPRFAPARHLVEVVLGAENEAPGELGLRTVGLMEAAYRSAQERRPVAIAELERC